MSISKFNLFRGKRLFNTKSHNLVAMWLLAGSVFTFLDNGLYADTAIVFADVILPPSANPALAKNLMSFDHNQHPDGQLQALALRIGGRQCQPITIHQEILNFLNINDLLRIALSENLTILVQHLARSESRSGVLKWQGQVTGVNRGRFELQYNPMIRTYTAIITVDDETIWEIHTDKQLVIMCQTR